MNSDTIINPITNGANSASPDLIGLAFGLSAIIMPIIAFGVSRALNNMSEANTTLKSIEDMFNNMDKDLK